MAEPNPHSIDLLRNRAPHPNPFARLQVSVLARLPCRHARLQVGSCMGMLDFMSAGSSNLERISAAPVTRPGDLEFGRQLKKNQIYATGTLSLQFPAPRSAPNRSRGRTQPCLFFWGTWLEAGCAGYRERWRILGAAPTTQTCLADVYMRGGHIPYMPPTRLLQPPWKIRIASFIPLGGLQHPQNPTHAESTCGERWAHTRLSFCRVARDPAAPAAEKQSKSVDGSHSDVGVPGRVARREAPSSAQTHPDPLRGPLRLLVRLLGCRTIKSPKKAAGGRAPPALQYRVHPCAVGPGFTLCGAVARRSNTRCFVFPATQLSALPHPCEKPAPAHDGAPADRRDSPGCTALIARVDTPAASFVRANQVAGVQMHRCERVLNGYGLALPGRIRSALGHETPAPSVSTISSTRLLPSYRYPRLRSAAQKGRYLASLSREDSFRRPGASLSIYRAETSSPPRFRPSEKRPVNCFRRLKPRGGVVSQPYLHTANPPVWRRLDDETPGFKTPARTEYYRREHPLTQNTHSFRPHLPKFRTESLAPAFLIVVSSMRFVSAPSPCPDICRGKPRSVVSVAALSRLGASQIGAESFLAIKTQLSEHLDVLHSGMKLEEKAAGGQRPVSVAKGWRNLERPASNLVSYSARSRRVAARLIAPRPANLARRIQGQRTAAFYRKNWAVFKRPTSCLTDAAAAVSTSSTDETRPVQWRVPGSDPHFRPILTAQGRVWLSRGASPDPPCARVDPPPARTTRHSVGPASAPAIQDLRRDFEWPTAQPTRSCCFGPHEVCRCMAGRAGKEAGEMRATGRTEQRQRGCLPGLQSPSPHRTGWLACADTDDVLRGLRERNPAAAGLVVLTRRLSVPPTHPRSSYEVNGRGHKRAVAAHAYNSSSRICTPRFQLTLAPDFPLATRPGRGLSIVVHLLEDQANNLRILEEAWRGRDGDGLAIRNRRKDRILFKKDGAESSPTDYFRVLRMRDLGTRDLETRYQCSMGCLREGFELEQTGNLARVRIVFIRKYLRWWSYRDSPGTRRECEPPCVVRAQDGCAALGQMKRPEKKPCQTLSWAADSHLGYCLDTPGEVLGVPDFEFEVGDVVREMFGLGRAGGAFGTAAFDINAPWGVPTVIPSCGGGKHRRERRTWRVQDKVGDVDIGASIANGLLAVEVSKCPEAGIRSGLAVSVDFDPDNPVAVAQFRELVEAASAVFRTYSDEKKRALEAVKTLNMYTKIDFIGSTLPEDALLYSMTRLVFRAGELQPRWKNYNARNASVVLLLSPAHRSRVCHSGISSDLRETRSGGCRNRAMSRGINCDAQQPYQGHMRPVKPYLCASLSDYVAGLLADPEIVRLINEAPDNFMKALGKPPPIFVNVWEAQSMKNLKGPVPGKHFADRGDRMRIALRLHSDLISIPEYILSDVYSTASTKLQFNFDIEFLELGFVVGATSRLLEATFAEVPYIVDLATYRLLLESHHRRRIAPVIPPLIRWSWGKRGK
ncbi:hypothetical protein C8R43DRAFT_957684 [Mycena crocata]|nr:hypothetical protein C8R43DRAFT_957684 [Mycena crocata]